MIVQGTAKKEVQPDIAYLQIGVMTTNVDAKQAQEENRIIANNMVRALLEYGIAQSDIETSSFSSFPRYETNSSGSSVLTSYEVRHIFRITVRDITKAGEVIDIAFENGANVSEGVSFEISNYAEVYRGVLQQAVIDGYLKAQAIAATLRVCLVPIPIKVEEVAQTLFPVPRYAAFSVQEKAATPIEPQLITINATVNIEYVY